MAAVTAGATLTLERQRSYTGFTMRPRLLGIAAAIVCLLPLSPETAAQRTMQSVARVAVLSPLAPGEAGLNTFRAALRDLGYQEGRNLTVEIRWAEGRMERLPSLARELVQFGPQVIFVGGEPALQAAKAATADIPIVVFACDPVDKLVVSLARPRGGATGVTCIHSEL